MYTRFGMDAFIENPMFLFVDEAETILPFIRSSEYGESDRIVELTDVGCDTEAIFPMHLPRYRDAYDRRRGGAETSFASARKIGKRRNEMPDKFSRATTFLNNDQDRKENYGGKTRHNDRIYDTVHIADLDYDPLAKNPYDDPEFTKDNPAIEYKDDYYARFVNPRDVIGHSRKEHLSRNMRYNYQRDPESSFTRDIPKRRRANVSSRWFANSDERNLNEIRGIDVRASERKRGKAFLRTDERTDFNRRDDHRLLAEFEKESRDTRRRMRDDFSNTIDADALSRNDFWDFIPWENEANSKELIFSSPTRTTDDNLQRRVPRNINSHPPERVGVIDAEKEEEFKEARWRNNRKDVSSKVTTGSARHRISKSDAVTEKIKILQSDTSNAHSPRIRSARISVDDRESISNAHPAEKNSNRPRSAIGEKETGINLASTERKGGVINATRANSPYREKFINKISDTSSNERAQSARASKRIATSNDDTYATNERDNNNSHGRNAGNNKIDRDNVAVSRSAPKEKFTENERTFALRMTSTSPHAQVEEKEKKRKFTSRLPVRTWKCLRTKELPAALGLESDTTNKCSNVNRKFQAANVEITNSNNRTNRIEDYEFHVENVEDRAIADRSDIKRSNRFETGSFHVDKAKSVSSNLKNIKGTKGLNIAKRADDQQRKTNIKG